MTPNSNNTNETFKANNDTSFIEEVRQDTIIDPRQLFTFTDSVIPYAPHLNADLTNFIANDSFMYRINEGVVFTKRRYLYKNIDKAEYIDKTIWLKYLLNCFADTIASRYEYKPTHGKMLLLTVYILKDGTSCIAPHYGIYYAISNCFNIPIQFGMYIYTDTGLPIGYYSNIYKINTLIANSCQISKKILYTERQLNDIELFYVPIMGLSHPIIYPEYINR